jgi:hypothetical protein
MVMRLVEGACSVAALHARSRTGRVIRRDWRSDVRGEAKIEWSNGSRYVSTGGTVAAVALAVALAAASSLADSQAAKVTADKVRAQGFPCTEPVSAQRDPAASRPDEAVWILDCSDARYRVRLMGDRPAMVERLQ